MRDDLKAEIEALERPDGEPVADRVVVKEDAFRGAHDEIVVRIPKSARSGWLEISSSTAALTVSTCVGSTSR